MNKDALDTFVLVINFLTLDWKSKHVTIGLFETKGTIGINLIHQLQALCKEYKLINKIIFYLENESTNLFTVTNVL
jgi:hypothetical protein